MVKVQETKLDAIDEGADRILLVAKHNFFDEFTQVWLELLTKHAKAMFHNATRSFTYLVERNELSQDLVDEWPQLSKYRCHRVYLSS